ncbi:MAG: nuclear transport factor 2 family protein [Spirochaetales bacterium]|nr:nuclear transport factor 2 family protein [Spirochaetales bacterium]
MKHKRPGLLPGTAVIAALMMLTACLGVEGTGIMKDIVQGAAETVQVEKPVHDYIEGWYDKDTERLRQGLHPALAKRHVDSSQSNGLMKHTLESLLKVVPQYGGPGGSGRTVDIRVFDVSGDIATAMVTSNSYVDYLHLGRFKTGWQIINVLWEFRSSAPPKLTDALKEEIARPVHDYVEGWYDKDAERVARGLHPDLAKRSLDPSQPDGVYKYTRDSLLADVPRYGGTNGKTRELEIEYLDVRATMASVAVVSASYIDYLHLGKIDGEWKIINALWKFR